MRSSRRQFLQLLGAGAAAATGIDVPSGFAQAAGPVKIGVDRDVACGVVDVKSFYMESAEDVAERLALCAKFIPVERLSAVPDCGFFPVPRWVAFEKLKRLVAGTRLARQQLGLV